MSSEAEISPVAAIFNEIPKKQRLRLRAPQSSERDEDGSALSRTVGSTSRRRSSQPQLHERLQIDKKEVLYNERDVDVGIQSELFNI